MRPRSRPAITLIEILVCIAIICQLGGASWGDIQNSFCEKNPECPPALLDVIGDWWSLLIVRDALLGKRRFGEFQKSLGLAKNILSTRLRKLVSHGVLEVGPASDGSAYQEYALTEKGRRLFIVLVALRQWGESCLFEEGELDLQLVDQKTGQPVKPLELRSKDGRILGPEDLRMVGTSD